MVVAIADIGNQEELTINYRMSGQPSSNSTSATTECHCGAPECTRTMEGATSGTTEVTARPRSRSAREVNLADDEPDDAQKALAKMQRDERARHRAQGTSTDLGANGVLGL